MKPEVKQDVLRVLNQVLRAMPRLDTRRIKDSSDQVIHSASIFQNRFQIWKHLGDILIQVSDTVKGLALRVTFRPKDLFAVPF